MKCTANGFRQVLGEFRFIPFLQHTIRNMKVTHTENFGGPLAKGLFLAAHLVPLGEFQKALTAQLTQKVVHVLAKSAEVGIRT